MLWKTLDIRRYRGDWRSYFDSKVGYSIIIGTEVTRRRKNESDN
ncbi:MAG: hypothetical protein Q8936_24690 [Bacillota bacterium]|nr:hypothetical protein [Bacillota bacterium]